MQIKSEMGGGKGVGGYRPPIVSWRDKALTLKRKNVAERKILLCVIITGIIIILTGIVLSVVAYTVISMAQADLDSGNSTHDLTPAAIGNYTYCGAYKKHYSNSQCKEVGLHYGINLQACEQICDGQDSCTAFNWSPYDDFKLGCVLRDCGKGIPPMPEGVNKDWISFSKKKPAIRDICVIR